MQIQFNRDAYRKIFDDLEKFKDFCRFEGKGYPFDEKDLYNDKSFVWRAYQKHRNLVRNKTKNFRDRKSVV